MFQKILILMLLSIASPLAFGVGAKVIGQTAIPGVHIIQAEDETLKDLFKVSSAAQTILNISVDGGEGPNSLGEAYVGHNKTAGTKKAITINDDGNVLFNQAEATAGVGVKGFSTSGGTIIFRVEDSAGSDKFNISGSGTVRIDGGDTDSRLLIGTSSGGSSAPQMTLEHASNVRAGIEIRNTASSTSANMFTAKINSTTSKFRISGNGKTELDVQTNGACGIGNVCSGNLALSVSSCTGGGNCDAAAFIGGAYSLVGDIVTMSFVVDIDSATGQTTVQWAGLPYSIGTNSYDMNGTCRFTGNAVTDEYVVFKATATVMEMRNQAPADGNNNTYACVVVYRRA